VRIGFVGLGDQGAPIARRISDAGFELSVWARRDPPLEPFRDGRVRIASSLTELGQESDLLLSCVFDGPANWEVLFGPGGAAHAMRPGSLIAVHSTIAPDEARELAEEARKHDLDLVDAPVSGGGPAAAAGQLVTMVGGDPAVFARCELVFASFSKKVVHLGPIGSGALTKLLNNAMLAAHLGIAADAYQLADELDLDRAGLAEVLAIGSGRSYGAEMFARSASLRTIAGTQARPTLTKDARLLDQVVGTLPDTERLGQNGDSLLVTVAGRVADRMDELSEAPE
jgi:3-hydroxyisobutyrate dehydrogenase